jgi:hypothetical protein
MSASVDTPTTAPAAIHRQGRGPGPVVAPEVAARIVARRVAGESLSVITTSLHMTPAEVRAVLDAGQVAEPVRVPRGLGEALVTAIGAAR